METKTLTTSEKGPAAVLRSGALFGLLRKMMNRHFTMAADEYRECASDSSVRKHGEEFDAAEAEFLNALAEVIEDKERLDWLDAQCRGVEFFTMDGHHDGALPRQFFQVDGLGLEKARPTLREAIDAGMRGPNNRDELQPSKT